MNTSWDLCVSAVAQKTEEKHSQISAKFDLMWDKKQQIYKSLTNSCQHERGQLPQETIKQAKGLLKHDRKGGFKKEFEDILGSYFIISCFILIIIKH